MGRMQHHKGKKRRRGWHRTNRESKQWLAAVRRLQRANG